MNESESREAWAAGIAARKSAKTKPAKKPNPDTPKPPTWLSEAGKAHWKPTIVSLAAVALRPADSNLLGLVCESTARYIAARDHAVDYPALDLTPSGLRQHAAHKAVADAVVELQRLLTAAGMSPAGRKGLVAPKAEQATPGSLGSSNGYFAT